MLLSESAFGQPADSIGHWKRLPTLPDPIGFAGIFAGVSGRSLLVAGGANFPDRKPWEGGVKTWSDKVFVLEGLTNRAWKMAGQLPRPLGYGVSITTPSGVICVGGSDSQRHYRDAFLMSWKTEKQSLAFEPLPPLPEPCANACGAFLDGAVYIAGGIQEPSSKTALKTFWSLDLRKQERGWQQLAPWPGPERMLAVAGAHDGSFFLFSGAALKDGKESKPVRVWLRDAYRYTPGAGWKKLADLPRATVAAPSLSFVRNEELLIPGGDDGSQVDAAPTQHTGFPRDVLAYNPRTDRWRRAAQMPFSLVTTVAAPWGRFVVIPGGEERPGIRSTEVWALEPQLNSP